MSKIYDSFKNELAAMGAGVDKNSAGYKRGVKIINSSLPVVGLSTPQMKELARNIPLGDRDEFMAGFFEDKELSYESVMVAGLAAAKKGDVSKTYEYLKKIIPLFASWAHSDTVVPLLKYTDKDAFLSEFGYLLDRDGQYEVRTYIVYMMACCLESDRFDRIIQTLKGVRYGRYYVDMAAAWLLSYAFIKFYDRTLPLFENKVFPVFVHNKAIQKARESFRLSDDKKQYIDTLKIRRQ